MSPLRLLTALAFAVLALLAGSAQASTLATPDGGLRPQPYQGWVDAALVPTPDGTVTLSLDGEETTLETSASTVGDVLDSEGLELGSHDVVAPDLGAAVNEGTRIAVKFGRPLIVNLDGEKSRHWVTATSVTTALQQIGLRLGGADLSVSRSAGISRSGLSLRAVTPKRVTLAVAGAKPVRKDVTALTVGQALAERGIKVDAIAPKMVWPLPDHQLRDFIMSKRKVLVVEVNYTGQLAQLLAARYRNDLVRLNTYGGVPFKVGDIVQFVESEVAQRV